MSRREAINCVLCPATPAAPRQSEASILAFPDGRLLLAYSDFFAGDPSDFGPGRISGRWSWNEGLSWGEPFVLQTNYGRLNLMEPSLLRLHSGRILLTYNRVESGGPGVTHPVIHLDLKHSADEGRTWSSPRQISTRDRENMTTNDRLVQLRSGRILLPASGEDNPVWLSDDDGNTWRLGHGLFACMAEPAVAERSDGRLLMFSREGSAGPGRQVYLAASDDAGETWRHAAHCPLGSAAVPVVVRRVPDSGDLLIIWNNHHTRTNLCSAISVDGGVTWSCIKPLEPQESWPLRRSHCYPSLTFLHGYAHMTYWESHRHPDLGMMIHLIYRRLPVDWFYEADSGQDLGATLVFNPSG